MVFELLVSIVLLSKFQIIGGQDIDNAVLPLVLIPVGTGLCCFIPGDSSPEKTTLLGSSCIWEAALLWKLGSTIGVLEELGITSSRQARKC